VLIDGFCKRGKLEEARKLFHEMPNINMCPNVVTYNAFVVCFVREGIWRRL